MTDGGIDRFVRKALLPQLGYGAAGGWMAVVVYVILLGSMLLLRWRSRAWQRIGF